MLTDKAFNLIKELNQSTDPIPPFENDNVRQILEEIKTIFEANRQQATSCSSSGDRTLWPLLNYRHAALLRNKRCLLAYLYQRMQKVKALRWEFGPIIPEDIRNALCESEITFFNNYSKSLAKYMRSLGEGQGWDLTVDSKPPKSLYVEVRCIEDYGKFELEDGETILLKKDSIHYLPRTEVEYLIRQGVLEHIG